MNVMFSLVFVSECGVDGSCVFSFVWIFCDGSGLGRCVICVLCFGLVWFVFMIVVFLLCFCDGIVVLCV